MAGGLVWAGVSGRSSTAEGTNIKKPAAGEKAAQVVEVVTNHPTGLV